MLNVNAFELKVADLDISKLVISLTIYENLQGQIEGSLVVKDNINFYDIN